MQNWIIRYVETLKARIEPTGCSIESALKVELPLMDRRTLLKLREAADDLHRILDLELGRRDEDATPLLDRIVEKLTVDAGLTASIEFPGCLVIPDVAGRGDWWFGTANDTWMGDLLSRDADAGLVLDTLDTELPSTCTNAGAIALAIAETLLDGAQWEATRAADEGSQS